MKTILAGVLAIFILTGQDAVAQSKPTECETIDFGIKHLQIEFDIAPDHRLDKDDAQAFVNETATPIFPVSGLLIYTHPKREGYSLILAYPEDGCYTGISVVIQTERMNQVLKQIRNNKN